MRTLKSYFGIVIPLAAVLFFSVAVQGFAQQNSTGNRDSTVNQILNEMQQEMDAGEESGATTLPDSVISPPTAGQQQLFGDSTLAMYQNAMYAYYEYRVSGFEHRKNVFAWQLFSSKLIFWAVLFLVFSGIVFSGIQFWKSIRAEQSGSASPAGDQVTEFEASAKGIRVTSPVLGVIILVISLAFFYLYLVYVYPIKEIF